MMNITVEIMAFTGASFFTEADTTESLPVHKENHLRQWPHFGWCLQYDIPILVINILSGIIGQGNWIFILSVLFCKSLRSPFNLIVVIKALGDGIFTIFDMPINIANVFQHFDPRKFKVLCEMQVFVRSCMYNMSILCHTTIAMVRFFCVVYKFKLSYRVSFLLASLVLLLPTVFSAVKVTDQQAVSMQICLMSLTKAGRKYHLFTVTVAAITFIITMICYIKIYMLLKQHTQNKCLNKISKYEAVTTWAGLGMSIIFLTSFILPYGAKVFPDVVQRTWKAYHVIGLAKSMMIINTGLSPVVYYYTLQSKHNAIVAAWRKFLRRVTVDPMNNGQTTGQTASSTAVTYM